MNGIVYGNRPETILRARDRLSSKVTNHVLLGTWLEVQERRGDWVRVETAGRGPGGWVHSDDENRCQILICDLKWHFNQ